jgi:hypothetical protein
VAKEPDLKEQIAELRDIAVGAIQRANELTIRLEALRLVLEEHHHLSHDAFEQTVAELRQIHQKAVAEAVAAETSAEEIAKLDRLLRGHKSIKH